MALADFFNGGAQTIQQILLQRQLEKMGVSPAQLAQRNQARQDQELALRQQEHADTVARQGRLDQEAAQQKVTGEANMLADQLPPGAFIPQSAADAGLAPEVGVMQAGGRGSLLTRSVKQSPAMGADFQGPMPGWETPQEAATGKQPGVVKQASQKQLDTNADNERQTAKDLAEDAFRHQSLDATERARQASQAAADAARQSTDAYRNMTAAETARHNKAIEGLSQERINKPAAASKLGQRDNDTVVTVHQMMPLVGQAISTLQKRVADQPPPKPGLLGAISQIPNKLERSAQSAAYSMGLGQPSDISNQIQLESLMQVMGSTPYLRGSRNYQLIKQIQQHLADPTATDAANLERLKQLQQILPGIEQAIYDVQNQGVIPHKHDANYSGAAPAAGGFSVREIK